LISTALEVLQKYAKRIRKGDVNLEDLLFTTHVSKKIEEYKVNNLVKSALLQLQDTGIYVQPGQSIQYIVREGERVKVVELLDGKEKIDTNFYLRQIVRCGESILLPFGYTFNKLEKYVK
jgi:DNA polymerase elongation subunit (family B)